jgi:hypothetical protein
MIYLMSLSLDIAMSLQPPNENTSNMSMRTIFTNSFINIEVIKNGGYEP